MMALPDVDSEAYMNACAEKSEEVDPACVNGMSREEILGHFRNWQARGGLHSKCLWHQIQNRPKPR